MKKFLLSLSPIQPKYTFYIIEGHSILLKQEYFTKIHALHALDWNSRFNPTLTYKVFNNHTMEEVLPEL